MSLQKLHTMLISHASNNAYRILSMDPGTDTLGLVFSETNLLTHRYTVVDAMTLYASKQLVHYPGVVATHGEKQGRLHAHRQTLIHMLYHWRPDAVVCEAPFMGKFPAAYGALVECLQIIREAVTAYRPYLTLELVDPPSAKKAVGVKAKGSSKNDVEIAIINAPDIHFREPLKRSGHSEHVYDGIAVGFWKHRQFIGE